MRTALVAYDTNVFRGAILHALAAQGFDAHGATDQKSLLALHAQLRPVLVVVSEHLQPFGAREAIRAVRGFDSAGSKIIAVTADVEVEVVQRLHEAGANEVISGGYAWLKLKQKLHMLKLM